MASSLAAAKRASDVVTAPPSYGTFKKLGTPLGHGGGGAGGARGGAARPEAAPRTRRDADAWAVRAVQVRGPGVPVGAGATRGPSGRLVGRRPPWPPLFSPSEKKEGRAVDARTARATFTSKIKGIGGRSDTSPRGWGGSRACRDFVQSARLTACTSPPCACARTRSPRPRSRRRGRSGAQMPPYARTLADVDDDEEEDSALASAGAGESPL